MRGVPGSMKVLLNTTGNAEGRRVTFVQAKHPTRKASGAKSHQGFRGPTLFWSGPLEP